LPPLAAAPEPWAGCADGLKLAPCLPPAALTAPPALAACRGICGCIHTCCMPPSCWKAYCCPWTPP